MDQLPDIIVLEIFKNLLYVDLCKCAQVCSRWYALAHSTRFKKKIILTRPLKPRQLSMLVRHHFREELEEVEFWIGNEPLPITKQTFYNLRTKCPHLKKLVLSACSLSYVTLEDMPDSLKYLSFRKSEINPYQIFGGRPHFSVPHLTCLDVSGVSNFLTSADLHIFSKLKSLRCLFMEGVFRINDGGIESIVDILGQLEVLDVEATDISDKGVHTILTHGSHLKELYMGHVIIGDGAFPERHLDRLMNLRTLCVSNTFVTALTMRKFTDCHIKFGITSDVKYIDNIWKEKSGLVGFYGCNHYLQHKCCS